MWSRLPIELLRMLDGQVANGAQLSERLRVRVSNPALRELEDGFDRKHAGALLRRLDQLLHLIPVNITHRPPP